MKLTKVQIANIAHHLKIASMKYSEDLIVLSHPSNDRFQLPRQALKDHADDARSLHDLFINASSVELTGGDGELDT